MRFLRIPVEPDVALQVIDRGEVQPGRRPVVCVHGLTRNARDFDVLATALAAETRVIAVDVAGRGGSDRLIDPLRYRNDIYAGHLITVLSALDLGAVDWIGTSMGGLIGMIVAATAPAAIARLVLNDVGAVIPAAALQRIGDYLAVDRTFESLAHAEAHFRKVHAPFGPLSDAEWRRLAGRSVRWTDDGRVVPTTDPLVRAAFAQPIAGDIELWPLWDAIRQPTLLLRGAESDLFPADVADRMAERDHVDLKTFSGVGHAPALMAPDQIETIRLWLAR
jgi:pimeloyl-ACP methyl ester carboxylesterase